MENKIILVTSGEPSGVGPDICLDLVKIKIINYIIVVIGDYSLLQERARIIKKPIKLVPLYSIEELVRVQRNSWSVNDQNMLYILHIECAKKDTLGKLDLSNVHYVLDTLNLAIKICKLGIGFCIVNAPISKEVINQVGINFTGHTEYFAHAFSCNKVVMMLANQYMKVALLTTHVPLKEVHKYVTADNLKATLDVIIKDFGKKYGIENPRIGVCGLNPHAGEGGYLGMEERDVINPVVDEYQRNGYKVSGAYSADTIFTRVSEFEVILAMYHDQGLPVLKYAGFNDGINITLGLPIIRVSVDHGTALELAGKGVASSSSMLNAVLHAVNLDDTTLK